MLVEAVRALAHGGDISRLDNATMNLAHSNATLAKYFMGGKRCVYSRKDIIVDQQSNEPYVYWIERGFVKVCRYSSRGSEVVLHIYKSEEVFPILAFIGQSAGPVFFVAYSDTVVRRRGTDELLAFMSQHPDTLLKVIEQQCFVFNPIITTRMETAEQKVVSHLSYLSSRFGVPDGVYRRITLPYTQQEFADSIGLSRETSGRILGRLESEGVIVRSRRQTLVHAKRLAVAASELEY